MTEPWCDVMDMAAIGCAHCQAQRSPERAAQLRAREASLHDRGGNTAPNRDVWAKSGPWSVVVAEYPGWCGLRCGDPISAGDEITRHGNAWAHLECVQSLRSD